MRKSGVIILFSSIFISLLTGCSGQGERGSSDEQSQTINNAGEVSYKYGSELADPVEKAFFNHLAQYYGQSFRGKQDFMAEGRESWEHMDFVMHVTALEDDRIYVPFHLDDDHSRTWMFLVEEGRLRFRHDHRHEDGTPEDITMYGGYGSGRGTAMKQDFPADEYTCGLIPTSCHAVWRVELSENPRTYSYMLFSHDELLFRGVFDLENPISNPN